MKLDYRSIGARLQEARKSAKLTQQKLADLMGVSVSYVKNTESGKKPSLEYLATVTDLCQVSYDWLLAGKDNLDKHPQEIVFDSETRDMIEVVKLMMSNPDTDLRTWAKVEFRRTFPEYFHEIDEKKEHA